VDSAKLTKIDVGLMLRRGAQAAAQEVLLTDAVQSRTGADLCRNVERLSCRLIEQGLSPGEPVAIILGDRVETIEAYWAIIEAGGVAVPVMPKCLTKGFARFATQKGICRAIAADDWVSDPNALGFVAGIYLSAAGKSFPGFDDYQHVVGEDRKARPVLRDDGDVCALNPVFEGGHFKLARRLNRSVAMTGGVSTFLTGTVERRLAVAMPIAGTILETVAWLALVFRIPIKIVDKDDPKALTDAISLWGANAVMSRRSIAESVLANLAPAPNLENSDRIEWTIVEAPSALDANAPYPPSSDQIHVRPVVMQDAAGFLCEYFSDIGAWRPLPTVAIAAIAPAGPQTAPGARGVFAVRAPSLSFGHYDQIDTAKDFSDGWMRIGGIIKLASDGFSGNKDASLSPGEGLTRDHATSTSPPDAGQLAHWCGLATAMDIGRMLRRGSRYFGDRLFVVSGERRITFDEMRRRTNFLSGGLVSAHGIRPGDRVAILMHNRAEWIEAYWAIVQIGAIVVPMNFRLGADELVVILNNCGAKLLIAEPEHRPLYPDLSKRTKLEEILTLNDDTIGDGDYERLIAAENPAPSYPVIDEEAPCSLLYTAGTTGSPKGAIRTHKGVMWFNLSTCISGLRMLEDGAYLATPPMFHIAGHETSLFTCLMRGLKLVTLDKFDAEEALQTIEAEKITSMFVPPTIGNALIAHLTQKSYDLSSLRDWSSASAPFPEPLRDKITKLLPWVRLRNSYGMTETGGIAAAEGPEFALKESTCVGLPAPTVHVRIEALGGGESAQGKLGQITIRSAQMLTEYWNNPSATMKAFADRWFHTEDIGHFDDDGHLHIQGRLKDMVITGGENVYAFEVEDVLLEVPEIAAVAMIGVPDEKWGEIVTAAIVPKPGQRIDPLEIINYCRQHIAHYKAPKRIYIMDALPQNAAGKVMKQKIRDDISQGRLAATSVPESQ